MSSSTADGPVPTFVGGAGRSGTTLVVDMLGLHPRISPVYETDFVVQLLELFFPGGSFDAEAPGVAPPVDEVASRIARYMDVWTRPLPLRPNNKRPHERYHHGPHYVLFDRRFALGCTEELIGAVRSQRVESGLAGFISRLFGEHCRLDGKPRWANKTPAYVHYLPVLGRLFPGMRFVHCVRDGRDVACSVVTRPWGPRTLGEAAEWWVHKVSAAAAFAQSDPGRCFEVRYEDLLREPVATVGRLFEWLGEGGAAGELIARYADGPVRLDSSRIGRWPEVFTAAESAHFEAVAGELLKRYGYWDRSD